MVDHVLDPREVGIALRRGAVLPAHVVLKFLPSPVLQVEGRVREDEIEFLGLVQVLEERVGIMITQIRVDATDREVHSRHLPCGRIALLTVHGDVVDVALMAFDEVRGLHEHAAAATARIY